MELYLAWGAETLGEIGAGEDEEGDGGNEEAAEEGEVTNGVEFLGARSGDGVRDALDGGEIGLESRADEGKAGEVTVDAGEGEGGALAVGDGGGGDDIKGVDGGVGGPAEGKGSEDAGEGGEIGQGVAAGTGGRGESGQGGEHGDILTWCAEREAFSWTHPMHVVCESRQRVPPPGASRASCRGVRRQMR